MRRLTIILVILVVIFAYHFALNSADYVELGIPKWSVALIQTSLTSLILYIFYRLVFNLNQRHAILSMTIFDRFGKSYKNKSAEFRLAETYLTTFNSKLVETLERNGFVNFLKSESRLLFKTSLYPFFLIDINKKNNQDVELTIYPFYTLYKTRELDSIPLEGIKKSLDDVLNT